MIHIKNKIFLVLIVIINTISFSQIKEATKEEKTSLKLQKFIEMIENEYVDSVNTEEIVEQGIKEMLKKLDPHSSYYSAKDVNETEAPLKGNFDGIGIRFSIDNDTINIVEVIEGGPSQKVGIQAGDKIIYINSENVATIKIKNEGVRDRLLGEKGSKVDVKILRVDEDNLLDITIIRDKIPIYSIPTYYMIDNEIGYIKIIRFASTTINEYEDAVRQLKSKGMKKLIIDLQGNGGGYLNIALAMCDEIINGKKLSLFTKGRAYPQKDFYTTNSGITQYEDVIILIDESSASASEILSGCVQDWDRGLIVGRRSFGKGLVEKQKDLPDKSRLRLTTQKYYTPSGRCIQKTYKLGDFGDYYSEKYTRRSELFHKDSIQIIDSTIYYTKINKRPIYGSIGIIPDVFVPIDTTNNSKLLLKYIRKSYFSNFSTKYINNNRLALKEKYKTEEEFLRNFDTIKVLEEFKKFIIEDKKDSISIEDLKEFDKYKKLFNLRLKADIGGAFLGQSVIYRAFNDIDETIIKAVEIYKSNEYSKYNFSIK